MLPKRREEPLGQIAMEEAAEANLGWAASRGLACRSHIYAHWWKKRQAEGSNQTKKRRKRPNNIIVSNSELPTINMKTQLTKQTKRAVTKEASCNISSTAMHKQRQTARMSRRTRKTAPDIAQRWACRSRLTKSLDHLESSHVNRDRRSPTTPEARRGRPWWPRSAATSHPGDHQRDKEIESQLRAAMENPW